MRSSRNVFLHRRGLVSAGFFHESAGSIPIIVAGQDKREGLALLHWTGFT